MARESPFVLHPAHACGGVSHNANSAAAKETVAHPMAACHPKLVPSTNSPAKGGPKVLPIDIASQLKPSRVPPCDPAAPRCRA